MRSWNCLAFARGFALLLPLVVSACGGSDSGGGATTGGVGQCSVGVAGDAPISSLSDADKKKVCAYYGCALSAALPQLQGGACAMAGIMTAMVMGGTDKVAACNDAKAQCMSAPSEEVVSSGPSDAQCASALAGCEATANEVSACLRDSMASMKSLMESFTCDKINDSSSSTASMPSDPQSCEAVSQKCPVLMASSQNNGS